MKPQYRLAAPMHYDLGQHATARGLFVRPAGDRRWEWVVTPRGVMGSFHLQCTRDGNWVLFDGWTASVHDYRRGSKRGVHFHGGWLGGCSIVDTEIQLHQALDLAARKFREQDALRRLS